ncbi:ABC transporter permease [Pasteurella multocida]|uniref:ABC transporter permease n=1 Tax=Pasteurella multocida TaxID=747 RepID=UPI00202160D6|nr:ABC transporter permease [Pasteurella multocida]MCL7798884.1 ABC transporter permease [Pasteurella multocida]MCL7805059.1 ABC transporter permease [Pasteurella multocida]MCL7808317.1 ABC transporter permease [Pasteurella multocida]MCL7809784.1 ABC transporter permease [Pasteurella multocida]MCL7813267.1 ABC transporter permease [Pasteurella multocida]
MLYGDQTTLKQSLVIQSRVIGALLMREIITRYGRRNLGFLWLFVEPFLMTGIIVVLWSSFRGNHNASLNIMAFMITGYPLMMMWRNTSNRAVGSVLANSALLYHHNVRALDTLIARAILEISGATIAQVVLMGICITLGWIPMPKDIFYMLLAWSLMGMFAIGFGFIICSIAYHIEFFGKLWGIVSFVTMPLSGAFFLVHNIPHQAHKYLLWAPMIHGSEMFRHGYFGDTIITYEDPWFLLKCNFILLFVGLLMVRNFSKGIEPR